MTAARCRPARWPPTGDDPLKDQVLAPGRPMPASGPTVGMDATPLGGGHGIRGIGRYLDGLLGALHAIEPIWMADELGVLVTRGQAVPAGVAGAWRTSRASWRPQDLDPLIALISDRSAIRGRRPRVWHHTDPAIPSTPLRASQTIVTVYDLIPLEVPAVLAMIRPHRRLAYRRYLGLVRQARGIIAISESTRLAVIRLLGVDAGRVHVVPPSVALPTPSATPVGAAPSGRTVYLFVGVPDPHKRPELAIATIAELVRRGRDAELTMVGVHPPAARARLVELATAAGIRDRVAFLDRVDDAALVHRYRAATTLALSSVEGFGLPPVEAMLAGGRVVATPTAAYLETLDGVATFASRADASSLADAAEEPAPGPTAEGLAALAERFGPAASARALRAAYAGMGIG